MKQFRLGKTFIAFALTFAMVASMIPSYANAAKVNVSKVKITKPATSTLVLKKGKTYKIGSTVTVKPNKSANKKVSYKTSKKAVVTVSSTGKLKAKKNGTAYITVTSKKNTKKKAKLKVIVGTPVTKVTLSKTSLSLKTGGTATLTATLTPKKPSVKGVTYVSSNTSVATVTSAGKVTAKTKGSATITATTKDGTNKKATCKVTVASSELTFADYDAMNWTWKTATKLKDLYANDFAIGIATDDYSLRFPCQANSFTRYHANSITMGNEMKVSSIFDGQATDELMEQGIDDPQINKAELDKILTYAKNNGLKVRFHTLVWHQQTPQPFYTKNYNGGCSDSDLVDKNTMNKRLEKYITHVIDYCEQKYPGVIYAYDVVNEALNIEKENNTLNQWYRIYAQKDGNGDIVPKSYYEYVVNAFKYARAAITKNNSSAKLYYNDYNTYMNANNVVDLISNCVNDGGVKNCDGIGMQSHLGLTNPSAESFVSTINKFAAAGLDVQITELDIGVTASSMGGVKLEEGAEKEKLFYNQAVRYKEIMKALQSVSSKVSSVTFWGLGDESPNWKQYEYPSMFYPDMTKTKPAFFGALQDSSIGDTFK